MRTYLNQKDEEVHLPDEVAELTREHASEVADAGELLTLASALALCPATAGTIVVEIGTYRGGTACFIGRTLRVLGRPLPVLSIDAFDLLSVEANNVQGDYAEYHNNVRKYGLEGQCMVLTGLSHSTVDLVPDRIGVLVVDGSHSYETVRGDIHDYAPKVVPGGVVFLDDYSPTFPGVVRAVDEFFGDSDEFEILHKTRNVLARRVG
ncbi:class I SAM-dependent methyltransferase [Phytohabitans houttuyneae]|uniref:O-methyltransferase n=1 Tax=Phytohabitans houttuyneae TaxID=1076126 RepID=A0A6V8K7G5_9ACTN|nr:class I SAM-dependent methyltransferase [Phytohabitans houttuyneae]GFJ78059.1 hypothetical protein Phou_022390 [Phytohabitans houttuyneae]